MEYWGDTNVSSQLYATYCKRKAHLSDAAVSSARLTAIKELHDELKHMALSQKVFFCMFGGLYTYQFNQCLTNWNDYGTEMVMEEDLL